MKKSARHFWCGHLLDSIVICSIAGVAAGLIYPIVAVNAQPAIQWLAASGLTGIALIATLVAVCIGSLLPPHVVAVVHGLFRFPRHFGLIVKAALASVVALAVTPMATTIPSFAAGEVLFFVALLVGELTLAYFIARLNGGYTGTLSGATAQRQKNSAQTWVSDDRPITDETSNLFPDHLDAANRILNRLLESPAHQHSTFPSIAILGGFGSGKSSICNLIRSGYESRRMAEKFPRMVFCRFEAWQYLSDDAAIKGLARAAARAILCHADVPELWSLPDQYLTLIKDSSGVWGKASSALAAQEYSPSRALRAIGATLERLDLRLVIFIDDLDRLQQTSAAAQHAVAQALNQFQNLPNVQYLVAVGSPSHSEENKIATLDLLKLTRYQELVPSMAQSVVAENVRRLRDDALADQSVFCPWGEVGPSDRDPLVGYRFLGEEEPGYLIKLITELLDTPRAFKSAMRDMRSLWNDGLKGEINWYGALLACSLKLSEPAIFEWIERDRELFLESGPSGILESQRNDERNALVEKLSQQIKGLLTRNDSDRESTVKTVLTMLFPNFGEKLGMNYGRETALSLHQGLGTAPMIGRSYLERFMSGCLTNNEVPDQPTLRFLHKARSHGIDRTEFLSTYLGTRENLLGPLNKFVQFADLLSLDRALSACDAILSWCAIPESRSVWPVTKDFDRDMMGDVSRIIQKSVERRDAITGADDMMVHHKAMADNISKWLQVKIKEYGASTWWMCDALLKWMPENRRGSVPAEEMVGIQAMLADILIQEISKKPIGSLLPEWMGRMAFQEFQRVLQEHPQHAQHFPHVVQTMLKEAELDKTHRLKACFVMSIVAWRHPVSKDPPPDSWSFETPKEFIEKNYDRSALESALRDWSKLDLPDPVARQALDTLKRDLNLQLVTPPSLEKNPHSSPAKDPA